MHSRQEGGGAGEENRCGDAHIDDERIVWNPIGQRMRPLSKDDSAIAEVGHCDGDRARKPLRGPIKGIRVWVRSPPHPLRRAPCSTRFHCGPQTCVPLPSRSASRRAQSRALAPCCTATRPRLFTGATCSGMSAADARRGRISEAQCHNNVRHATCRLPSEWVHVHPKWTQACQAYL